MRSKENQSQGYTSRMDCPGIVLVYNVLFKFTDAGPSGRAV